MGVGYDGYPLGCGCERCQDYAYYDRFRDQVNWVYEVAVQKHHKKLWLWTWVCGTNSVLPGYEHYYGWVKEFAEANPKSVYISSFATEADFLITHRPNPVIGSRGPNDMGMVLLWPEYRGDGVVPAWLLNWMETNLPLLRLQGACGFAGTDTISSKREQDLIQSAENYALSEMMWDHSVTAEQAALEYCERKFGPQAAALIAPALLQSGSAITKTLFLPDGIRFSGHSHIENDLPRHVEYLHPLRQRPLLPRRPNPCQDPQSRPTLSAKSRSRLSRSQIDQKEHRGYPCRQKRGRR